MKFLESIFTLLESNKKFPYYQAERRVDIFINFFIKDIIRQHTVYKDAVYIAAEFPLKKSTATDHAAHIDYLMFSKKSQAVLFVELKTDDVSYDADQIQFYLQDKKFIKWYEKFVDIKMKGFKDKKETLIKAIKDRLKDDLELAEIRVIVIKPTHGEKDYHKLNDKRELLHFVSLKGMYIKTKYQAEWDLFKKIVLNKI